MVSMWGTVAKREFGSIETREKNVSTEQSSQNKMSNSIQFPRHLFFFNHLFFCSQLNRPSLLRVVSTPLHRSTREDNLHMGCGALVIKTDEHEEPEAAVPLKNVTVEAWIDAFAADVTINQVFVNQERKPIEAIYVFPIEVCLSRRFHILTIDIHYILLSCRRMPLSTRSRHRSMIEPSSPKSKRKLRLNKNTKMLSRKAERPCFFDKVNRPSTHSWSVSLSPSGSISFSTMCLDQCWIVGGWRDVCDHDQICQRTGDGRWQFDSVRCANDDLSAIQSVNRWISITGSHAHEIHPNDTLFALVSGTCRPS